MDFYVCGDIHGNINQIEGEQYKVGNDNAIIVLGDFGANFHLNAADYVFKEKVNSIGCKWYIVKGNHEARPKDISSMCRIYDKDVEGWVWIEYEFPNIRYFEEYGIYQLGKYRCAVIGGAYSVDKWYRLQKHFTWFATEQLDDEEKKECENLLINNSVDFVFSHTCPISWKPTELFLSGLNQSTVDTSTEVWLENLSTLFGWNVWLFGHFHDDQLVRPHVEMYYKYCEKLDDIAARWSRYDNNGELDWWLKKSPNFYMK